MMKPLLLGWLALVVCTVGVQAAEPLKVHSKLAAKAKAARPQPAVAVQESEPIAALSDAHLAIAQRVVLGKVPCELGANVAVSAHPSAPGHFVLEHGRQKFLMLPVLTSTGAIRLEDFTSGAVWLQLANKSMLMDQKQGRRLADACMNAEQLVVADAMARSPAPNLLEPLPIPAAVVALPVEAQAAAVQAATN